MLSLTRIEYLKLSHKLRSFLGSMIITALLALMAIGFALHPPGMPGGVAMQAGFVMVGSPLSAFLVTRMVMEVLLVLLIPFICLGVGDLVAGEAEDHTLRTVLCRPPSRARFLAAKVAAAFGFTGAHVIFVIGVPLVVFGFIFGYGPMFIFGQKVAIIGRGEALLRLLGSGLYMIWGLMVLASLGLLLSVLVEKAIGPAIGTFAIFSALMIIGTIPLGFLKTISPYLFTTQLFKWSLLVSEPIPWGEVTRGIVTLGVWSGVCLAAAFLIFSRKDITC